MSKVLLTAFIDGLKPESLVHMPFLNSFPYRKRIKTDLGYSITCHATMYSGVYPHRHKMWFLWKYSPETSPFRGLPQTELLKYIDYLPSRYLIGKMFRLFSKNTSYGGLPIMKRSSFMNWRHFDLSESRFWDEDRYLEDTPTIFEILRKEDIPYETAGFMDSRSNGGAISHTTNYKLGKSKDKWIYLFIGEVDYYSHLYTQEDDFTITFLGRVDREIQRIFDQLNQQYDEVDFICFSDHGHMKVEHKFDIYRLFKRHGFNLNYFIHIIDTNYARFWFRNTQEERVVRQVIRAIPSGFVLEEEHCKKYHTTMPDNRYGDLIYYLDHPYMFQKTVWGYGLRTKSIHGYLPDYEGKDGVLVSNVPTRDGDYVELTDITPSILELLDVTSSFEFDGYSIWR